MSTVCVNSTIDRQTANAAGRANPATLLVRFTRGLIHQVRRRRQLYRYLALDDRMLDDIGLTREEVYWALRQPLRVNAAVAMHTRAKARRRAG